MPITVKSATRRSADVAVSVEVCVCGRERVRGRALYVFIACCSVVLRQRITKFHEVAVG